MKAMQRRMHVFVTCAAFLGGTAVHAQDYPVKPVRIVTTGIGGAADFLIRLMVPPLSSGLGQQVIVDNRGAGVIPGDVVAKSAPDGYTLLAYGQPLWLSSLMQGAPYDPIRDFAPITLATRAPNVLVVHPSLPVKSVKELIALAKARPGQLNYASPAIGGSAHLAAELSIRWPASASCASTIRAPAPASLISSAAMYR